MWRSNGCRFAGLRVKRAPNRRRWVAVHVPHTARKLGPGLRGVASGWLLSRLRCSACALFSYVLSAILAKERFLQFQLRRDSFEERHHVCELVPATTRCLLFVISQECAELEQVFAFDVFEKELGAGLHEVGQRRVVRG